MFVWAPTVAPTIFKVTNNALNEEGRISVEVIHSVGMNVSLGMVELPPILVVGEAIGGADSRVRSARVAHILRVKVEDVLPPEFFN